MLRGVRGIASVPLQTWQRPQHFKNLALQQRDESLGPGFPIRNEVSVCLNALASLFALVPQAASTVIAPLS